MYGKQQLPVSELLAQGQQLGDVELQKRSKNEYRKQKELEDQRKAGEAPAMVDCETGRDINPHIPEFIEKTPWYATSKATGPTLKHQRPHPEREKQLSSIKDWYTKGVGTKRAFKYRDGACENCGAMGHSKKTCMEKPRAVGAKHTNSNIAPDDNELPGLSMGWDAKRDRWNGYDSAQYKLVYDEYERMEATRKLIKAQNAVDGITDAEVKDDAEDNVDKELHYAEGMAPVQGIDMDSRTRITVRDLRIREDTAKYLCNLDANSAYYDPKSRSMRDNPFKDMPGKEYEAAKFAGENFIRYSGEVVKANEAQVFAWEATSKGVNLHPFGEPTKLETLKKVYENERDVVRDSIKQDIFDKYGAKFPQRDLNIWNVLDSDEHEKKEADENDVQRHEAAEMD